MALKGLFFVQILGKEERMEEIKKICSEIKFAPKVELVEEKGKSKLYLYGSIVEEVPTNWWTGEAMEGDYITIKDIKEAFKEINEDSVEIHINSKGGDVYSSVAIGNFIKESDKHITVIVDAIAASGASIIAMAGDEVKMYPNSLMMIHRASAACYGNAEELRKIADNLEKFDEAVQASYMGHFKGSKEELKKLIFDETYLTAEESLTLGFCDEIIEKPDKEVGTDTKVSNIKNSLLEKYRIDTIDKIKSEVEKKNILNKFKGDRI